MNILFGCISRATFHKCRVNTYSELRKLYGHVTKFHARKLLPQKILSCGINLSFIISLLVIYCIYSVFKSIKLIGKSPWVFNKKVVKIWKIHRKHL